MFSARQWHWVSGETGQQRVFSHVLRLHYVYGFFWTCGEHGYIPMPGLFPMRNPAERVDSSVALFFLSTTPYCEYEWLYSYRPRLRRGRTSG